MDSLKPKKYEIPYGRIDKTGVIITEAKGFTYYGCPYCGACFVWDCSCGFVTLKRS